MSKLALRTPPFSIWKSLMRINEVGEAMCIVYILNSFACIVKI